MVSKRKMRGRATERNLPPRVKRGSGRKNGVKGNPGVNFVQRGHG